MSGVDVVDLVESDVDSDGDEPVIHPPPLNPLLRKGYELVQAQDIYGTWLPLTGEELLSVGHAQFIPIHRSVDIYTEKEVCSAPAQVGDLSPFPFSTTRTNFSQSRKAGDRSVCVHHLQVTGMRRWKRLLIAALEYDQNQYR